MRPSKAFGLVLWSTLLSSLVPSHAQMLRQVHTVTADVVAVDARATQLKFLTSDGRTLTLPVEKRALEDYANFSPGDPVTLSCRDFERGEHFAIFEIVRRARP